MSKQGLVHAKLTGWVAVQLRCGGGGCSNVVSACRQMEGCLGYRLNREGTWATLKGGWVGGWGP